MLINKLLAIPQKGFRLLRGVSQRQVNRTRVSYEIFKETLRREFDRVLNGSDIRKKHIVICGYPRSGTSLFYNMLRTSLDRFNFDDQERTSTETIRKYDNHVSKKPLDIFEVNNLPRYNIHNKEIIVIILLRDMRDILTSIHENVPNDYFIGYEGSYSIFGRFPNYQAIFNGPGIGDIFQEIEPLKNSPDFNLAFIKYEDLVNDPDQVQEFLASKLNLAFKRSFSEFYLHKDQHAFKKARAVSLDPSLLKIDKKASTEYVGRWRLDKHRERIRQQFTHYPELFTILRVYGYEKHDDWFQDFKDS